MSIPKGMWECLNCGDYVSGRETVCPNCAGKYGDKCAASASFRMHRPVRTGKTGFLCFPAEPAADGDPKDTAGGLKFLTWLSMDFGCANGHFTIIHF